MTNNLQRAAAKPVSARSKRSHQGLPRRSARAKAGWSPERRARQAALIRRWAPWRRSTEPKTNLGKTRCAMNALKHGYRSQASIQLRRQVRHVLCLSERNIKLIRLHLRIRDAQPRINYKFLPPHALRSSNLLALLLARFDCLLSSSARGARGPISSSGAPAGPSPPEGGGGGNACAPW